MTKTAKCLKIFGCAFIAWSAVLSSLEVRAESGDFSGYEIRVIRPRYMAKRNRLELGGQMGLVMNESFIYTFMISGMLDFHFSEMFALEVGAAKGLSIDKEDKRILEDEFDIKTSIRRTNYTLTGGLLWTPMYGKTQLPSGYVVYFDNFLSMQGGMTGIEYKYERCDKTLEQTNIAPPSPTTKSYPTLNIGFGQKFFVSQNVSIRWDVRDNLFLYNPDDGECAPPAEASPSAMQNNITLQFGSKLRT